ncbi:MAG: Ferrochelatase [Bacteroidia bacterium]|nr:Ferrochelatase [Bacteroidia bacterium]
MKTGVLLINLGTPDSPSVSDVRKYLFQFLNDPRVIDIPWLARTLLVNLIIVPFRAPKSAKIYKELWTEKGSPLLIYGNELKEKVQTELGTEYTVELAMRYQKPSIESVLEKMRKENYKKIVIVPLYPQYASSSTGSTLELVLKEISKWYVIPELKIVSQFFDNEGYINAFVERGKQYNPEEYEHVIFSFHGLPVRQVDKVYEDSKPCSDHNCENEISDDNYYCYKASSFATAKAIAERLNIPKAKYTVSFQSRLDEKWLEPFSDKVVEQKAKEGIKKLLVFSPAFVADCLETTIEIGHEYSEIFKSNGGENLQLVESLNAHPIWVNTIAGMVKS